MPSKKNQTDVIMEMKTQQIERFFAMLKKLNIPISLSLHAKLITANNGLIVFYLKCGS